MIRRLMGHRADIVHRSRTGEDRRGNPTVTETGRDVGVLCRLEQSATTEGTVGVVDQWRAYFLPGTNISALDVVEEGGRRFEVQGTPSNERVPGFPQADHIAATLKYIGETS